MDPLVDPSEPLERQNYKLRAITTALIRRVESQTERSGAAYAQFERATVLEDQVRRRTRDLEQALGLLNQSNAKLATAMREAEEARSDMASAIEAVREGFALFGADDVLLLYNRRFCWHLPDVREQLRRELPFRDYIGLVSRSPILTLPPDMRPQDWARERMARHRDSRATFNLALKGDRWLQISEHRTENAGTAIVQTDVTDIIRAERLERDRLLDGRDRLVRATLDHLDQGVAIFDESAHLIGWNQRIRDLTGLPATVWRLGTAFARVANQLAQEFAMHDPQEERMLGLWVSGQARQAQLSFEIARGETRVLAVFMQRLPDNGFVVSFTDVTAEREARRSLARANETLERRVEERTLELRDALQAAERTNAAKTRFVAAASHDLLQPLSAAKLYLARAGSECPGEAGTIHKAEQALTSVEEIIGALLDISRLDTEERAFDIRAVRLADLLEPLAAAFAPAAAASGLSLRVVPSSAVVMSDPSFLRRILQNLVSNAIRYTETGGVLVGARKQGASVRVEVWDTGPGIAEPDRARIFDEFTRLDRRASASEGMGLGLAIVERACARLGHGLDLVSTPGRGSGFRVSLDLAVGTLSAPEQAPSPIAQNDGDLHGCGLIALLVDNDHEMRSALVGLLEQWGLDVIEAAGAAEAMDLIDDLGIVPDLLLLDQQLGGDETGLALSAAFRARHGPCPVCIISADRSERLAADCAAVGLDLLPKPLDPKALWAFVRGVAAP